VIFCIAGTSETVAAGAILGSGGQGRVYETDRPGYVAKEVDGADDEYALRVTHQVRWSGLPETAARPTALLTDAAGSPRGCLMKRARGLPLEEVVNPAAAGRPMRLRALLDVGILLAETLAQFHAAGMLWGDANGANAVVEFGRVWRRTPKRVWVIDPDGWEFTARGKSGALVRFRAGVGVEPYLAPELQGKHLRVTDRTEATDSFALAVLTYQLVKGGTHPYALAGNYTAIPTIGEAIERGLFGLDPRCALPAGTRPVDSGLLWQEVPPAVRRLFVRGFVDGTRSPAARPSPGEWAQALREWQKQLGWWKWKRPGSIRYRVPSARWLLCRPVLIGAAIAIGVWGLGLPDVGPRPVDKGPVSPPAAMEPVPTKVLAPRPDPLPDAPRLWKQLVEQSR
jgi:DNA-binding helix-hairpin-helix protein with protein kinase domain